MVFHQLLPNYKRINRSCTGKIRHRLEAKALAHKFELEARGKTRGGELSAYYCAECHGWHVGHATRAALKQN